MNLKNKQNKSDNARTPQKSINKLTFSSKRNTEQTITKQLLSPFIDSFFVNMPSVTPLKRQVEYLLSPSPVKKDLFSQLLGSEIKQHSPGFTHSSNNSILEQQDYDCVSSDTIKQDQEESELSYSSDNQQGISDEQNGIRKRKRKSTAQIRMLKQQLDGEMNWTKQKIVKMAEVTGLSQSQVYKWCWDQKKKTIKHRDSKRKFIKKQFNSNKDYQRYQNDDKNDERQMEEMQKELFTKPKLSYMRLAEQNNTDTQKKISKKLIFN